MADLTFEMLEPQLSLMVAGLIVEQVNRFPADRQDFLRSERFKQIAETERRSMLDAYLEDMRKDQRNQVVYTLSTRVRRADLDPYFALMLCSYPAIRRDLIGPHPASQCFDPVLGFLDGFTSTIDGVTIGTIDGVPIAPKSAERATQTLELFFEPSMLALVPNIGERLQNRVRRMGTHRYLSRRTVEPTWAYNGWRLVPPDADKSSLATDAATPDVVNLSDLPEDEQVAVLGSLGIPPGEAHKALKWRDGSAD